MGLKRKEGEVSGGCPSAVQTRACRRFFRLAGGTEPKPGGAFDRLFPAKFLVLQHHRGTPHALFFVAMSHHRVVVAASSAHGGGGGGRVREGMKPSKGVFVLAPYPTMGGGEGDGGGGL